LASYYFSSKELRHQAQWYAKYGISRFFGSEVCPVGDIIMDLSIAFNLGLQIINKEIAPAFFENITFLIFIWHSDVK
jgi:hypothetical protein